MGGGGYRALYCMRFSFCPSESPCGAARLWQAHSRRPLSEAVRMLASRHTRPPRQLVVPDLCYQASMVPGRPLMVAQPLTGATVGPSPSKYLTMRGTSWSCSALGLCLSGAHLCDLMAVSSLSGMRSVEPHALQFGSLRSLRASLVLGIWLPQ